MDWEIIRVHYKWWGVCLNKCQWVDVLSRRVREIGDAATLSETRWIMVIFLTDTRFQFIEQEMKICSIVERK
jgi:hypothetical protein